MSTNRRLVQRRRGAGGDASRPSAANRSANVELPPYEQPACPLSAEGKRELNVLGIHRDTRSYETHIKAAIENLGKSTAGINDCLRNRHGRLESLRRKSDDALQAQKEQEWLGTYTTDLEEQVAQLTDLSEQSVRDLLDSLVALEDEKAVLGALSSQIATQSNQAPAQRRSRADGDEEAGQRDEVDMQDSPDPSPVKSTLDMLREAKLEKSAEYDSLDAHQRYARNNDYVHFKKLWHDAANGDEIPLPNASRWFDAQGRPVMTVARPRHDGGGVAEDDEEEDLVVAAETTDFKCPLSLKDIEEPLTSRKCGHTFDRDSILDYIGAQGQVTCPVPGCKKGPEGQDTTFTKDDLYRDEVFIRRARRHRQREQELADQEMAAHDANPDDSLAISRTQESPRKVKREKVRRSRRVVDDIMDED